MAFLYNIHNGDTITSLANWYEVPQTNICDSSTGEPILTLTDQSQVLIKFTYPIYGVYQYFINSNSITEAAIIKDTNTSKGLLYCLNYPKLDPHNTINNNINNLEYLIAPYNDPNTVPVIPESVFLINNGSPYFFTYKNYSKEDKYSYCQIYEYVNGDMICKVSYFKTLVSNTDTWTKVGSPKDNTSAYVTYTVNNKIVPKSYTTLFYLTTIGSIANIYKRVSRIPPGVKPFDIPTSNDDYIDGSTKQIEKNEPISLNDTDVFYEYYMDTSLEEALCIETHPNNIELNKVYVKLANGVWSIGVSQTLPDFIYIDKVFYNNHNLSIVENYNLDFNNKFVNNYLSQAYQDWLREDSTSGQELGWFFNLQWYWYQIFADESRADLPTIGNVPGYPINIYKYYDGDTAFYLETYTNPDTNIVEKWRGPKFADEYKEFIAYVNSLFVKLGYYTDDYQQAITYMRNTIIKYNDFYPVTVWNDSVAKNPRGDTVWFFNLSTISPYIKLSGYDWKYYQYATYINNKFRVPYIYSCNNISYYDLISYNKPNIYVENQIGYYVDSSTYQVNPYAFMNHPIVTSSNFTVNPYFYFLFNNEVIYYNKFCDFSYIDSSQNTGMYILGGRVNLNNPVNTFNFNDSGIVSYIFMVDNCTKMQDGILNRNNTDLFVESYLTDGVFLHTSMPFYHDYHTYPNIPRIYDYLNHYTLRLQIVGKLLIPRRGHRSIYRDVDHAIYTFGGLYYDNNLQSEQFCYKVEKYDIATQQSTIVSNLDISMYNFSIPKINLQTDIAYLVGGIYETKNITANPILLNMNNVDNNGTFYVSQVFTNTRYNPFDREIIPYYLINPVSSYPIQKGNTLFLTMKSLSDDKIVLKNIPSSVQEVTLESKILNDLYITLSNTAVNSYVNNISTFKIKELPLSIDINKITYDVSFNVTINTKNGETLLDSIVDTSNINSVYSLLLTTEVDYKLTAYDYTTLINNNILYTNNNLSTINTNNKLFNLSGSSIHTKNSKQFEFNDSSFNTFYNRTYNYYLYKKELNTSIPCTIQSVNDPTVVLQLQNYTELQSTLSVLETNNIDYLIQLSVNNHLYNSSGELVINGGNATFTMSNASVLYNIIDTYPTLPTIKIVGVVYKNAELTFDTSLNNIQLVNNGEFNKYGLDVGDKVTICVKDSYNTSYNNGYVYLSSANVISAMNIQKTSIDLNNTDNISTIFINMNTNNIYNFFTDIVSRKYNYSINKVTCDLDITWILDKTSIPTNLVNFSCNKFKNSDFILTGINETCLLEVVDKSNSVLDFVNSNGDSTSILSNIQRTDSYLKISIGSSYIESYICNSNKFRIYGKLLNYNFVPTTNGYYKYNDPVNVSHDIITLDMSSNNYMKTTYDVYISYTNGSSTVIETTLLDSNITNNEYNVKFTNNMLLDTSINSIKVVYRRYDTLYAIGYGDTSNTPIRLNQQYDKLYLSIATYDGYYYRRGVEGDEYLSIYLDPSSNIALQLYDYTNEMIIQFFPKIPCFKNEIITNFDQFKNVPQIKFTSSQLYDFYNVNKDYNLVILITQINKQEISQNILAYSFTTNQIISAIKMPTALCDAVTVSDTDLGNIYIFGGYKYWFYTDSELGYSKYPVMNEVGSEIIERNINNNVIIFNTLNLSLNSYKVYDGINKWKINAASITSSGEIYLNASTKMGTGFEDIIFPKRDVSVSKGLSSIKDIEHNVCVLNYKKTFAYKTRLKDVELNSKSMNEFITSWTYPSGVEFSSSINSNFYATIYSSPQSISYKGINSKFNMSENSPPWWSWKEAFEDSNSYGRINSKLKLILPTQSTICLVYDEPERGTTSNNIMMKNCRVTLKGDALSYTDQFLLYGPLFIVQLDGQPRDSFHHYRNARIGSDGKVYDEIRMFVIEEKPKYENWVMPLIWGVTAFVAVLSIVVTFGASTPLVGAWLAKQATLLSVMSVLNTSFIVAGFAGTAAFAYGMITGNELVAEIGGIFMGGELGIVLKGLGLLAKAIIIRLLPFTRILNKIGTAIKVTFKPLAFVASKFPEPTIINGLTEFSDAVRKVSDIDNSLYLLRTDIQKIKEKYIVVTTKRKLKVIDALKFSKEKLTKYYEDLKKVIELGSIDDAVIQSDGMKEIIEGVTARIKAIADELDNIKRLEDEIRKIATNIVDNTNPKLLKGIGDTTSDIVAIPDNIPLLPATKVKSNALGIQKLRRFFQRTKVPANLIDNGMKEFYNPAFAIEPSIIDDTVRNSKLDDIYTITDDTVELYDYPVDVYDSGTVSLYDDLPVQYGDNSQFSKEVIDDIDNIVDSEFIGPVSQQFDDEIRMGDDIFKQTSAMENAADEFIEIADELGRIDPVIDTAASINKLTDSRIRLLNDIKNVDDIVKNKISDLKAIAEVDNTVNARIASEINLVSKNSVDRITTIKLINSLTNNGFDTTILTSKELTRLQEILSVIKVSRLNNAKLYGSLINNIDSLSKIGINKSNFDKFIRSIMAIDQPINEQTISNIVKTVESNKIFNEIIDILNEQSIWSNTRGTFIRSVVHGGVRFRIYAVDGIQKAVSYSKELNKFFEFPYYRIDSDEFIFNKYITEVVDGVEVTFTKQYTYTYIDEAFYQSISSGASKILYRQGSVYNIIGGDVVKMGEYASKHIIDKYKNAIDFEFNGIF